MTTTTSYGTWCNRVDDLSISVAQSVTEWLGGYASDYDTDGLTDTYRAAINAALPHNVALSDDDFIGPYDAADQQFDGYPLADDGRLDLKAIVGGVDFWALAEQHLIADGGPAA
jgi:hypothetical protein